MKKTPHQSVTVNLTKPEAERLRGLLMDLGTVGDSDARLKAVLAKVNRAMGDCFGCELASRGYKGTVTHTCRTGTKLGPALYALCAEAGATCALCGNPALGFAVAEGVRLCHHEARDCYRQWTVYGRRARGDS